MDVPFNVCSYIHCSNKHISRKVSQSSFSSTWDLLWNYFSSLSFLCALEVTMSHVKYSQITENYDYMQSSLQEELIVHKKSGRNLLPNTVIWTVHDSGELWISSASSSSQTSLEKTWLVHLSFGLCLVSLCDTSRVCSVNESDTFFFFA